MHSHEPKEIGEIDNGDLDSQTVKRNSHLYIHKQFEIQNPKKESTQETKRRERERERQNMWDLSAQVMHSICQPKCLNKSLSLYLTTLRANIKGLKQLIVAFDERILLH